MKSSNRAVSLTLSVLAVILVFAIKVNAQSTIFSMPSTDILAKKTIGIRFAAKFKFNDEPAKKRFTAFTPRVIVSLNKDMEIGLNVLGNIQPGVDTTTLVPTIKWRMYNNEKAGVAIVLGDNLYIPVRKKKYNVGTYTYLQASKVFKKTKTRLTFGTYLFSKDVVASKASRGGGQFALEQTINRRLTFAAEWITGKHSGGYFMPGLKIKLHKQVSTNVGYTINNSRASRGNHFFYVALGINFGY